MGVLRVKVAGQWVDVAGAPPPNRNILDNAQFEINQRFAGSLSVPSTGAGTILIDRWTIFNSGVGVCATGWGPTGAVGNNTWPLPPRPRPAHIPYIQMTTGEAAASMAASDYILWRQAVEGYNVQHLAFGTANAQPVTATFDCFANVAMTFIARLDTNGGGVQRYYSIPVTIPANAWTTVTLTYPGDTGGNKLDDDSSGRLDWGVMLCAGTTFTGTPLPNAWTTTTTAMATGVSNTFQATAGNYFMMTNVKLEVGSFPTLFVPRSFDEELRACQRYYEKSYAYETAPASNVGSTGSARGWVFDSAVPGRLIHAGTQFIVPKRAIPVVSFYAPDGTAGMTNAYNGVTKISLSGNGPDMRQVEASYLNLGAGGVLASYYPFHWVASAELI